jgi:signal transduction histidine kinase
MLSPLTTRFLSPRATELFNAHCDFVWRRTDRVFACLMTLQFVAGLIVAVTISPKAWEGSQSHVHLHVWTALLLGAVITALPVTLALIWPGRLLTRCVIASGQMLTSGLLIHLSGGRIETHFHIFGSLAFIAFYRDWRVFVPATFVVALDHLVRGFYWPESVYGVLTASPWRSLEHAGWVMFENIFLVRSCLAIIQEMQDIAEKRAQLENTNEIVEIEVRQRTAELSAQALTLQNEIAERKNAETQREDMHRQLMAASRQAGMTEVATGVLHNVGNVLNSVNVSTAMLVTKVQKSESAKVGKIAELLEANANHIGDFVTSDEKGRHIPKFLVELGRHLVGEQSEMLTELDSLTRNIDHIKNIVSMQQKYSRVCGVIETVNLADVVDDAIHISNVALQRHGIKLIREFRDAPAIKVDKHTIMQILVNLISNAKQALADSGRSDKVITIRIRMSPRDDNRVLVEVSDNGVGIPSENLSRVFAYGFTTKAQGHGFGLHSCSLAALQLSGTLTAQSEGPGCGAVFVLELPLVAKSHSSNVLETVPSVSPADSGVSCGPPRVNQAILQVPMEPVS